MIERDLPAGPGTVARVRFTDRTDGNLHIDAPGVEATRRRIVDLPWTWLRQVHGATVVEVDSPGARSGLEADGAVTTVRGAVLAVQTADCAPVVLVADGCVAAVHAGWRGIASGILGAAVEEVRRRADGPIRAVLGPCIHPAGYEFGSTELDEVVAVAGPAARGVTREGAPALDLPAAVEGALRASAVTSFEHTGHDTCDVGFHSHRARGDTGRQSGVVWLEDQPAGERR
jgi:YfiH family protein